MIESTPTSKPVSTGLIITIVLVIIVAVLGVIAFKEHGTASKYKKQCKAHKKEIKHLSSSNHELAVRLNQVVVTSDHNSQEEEEEEEKERTTKKPDKSK